MALLRRHPTDAYRLEADRLLTAKVVTTTTGVKSQRDRQKICQPIYTGGRVSGSMRHQKMISLDGETLKIAEKINNFSGWVRDQLRQFDAVTNPPKKYGYVCYECNKIWWYPTDHGESSICRKWDCKSRSEIGRYVE